MNDYITTKEACAIAKVKPPVIRRYANEGKIRFVKTESNRFRYLKEDVEKFFAVTGSSSLNKNKTAFYIRSSSGDESSLKTQTKNLRDAFGKEDYLISDRASGLKADRVGIKKLLRLAKDGEIERICATHSDRLTRFGFFYLETLFADRGVSVEFSDKEQDETIYDELMNDFMSLIASFSGKFYRIRGWENQKKLLKRAESIIAEKQNN